MRNPDSKPRDNARERAAKIGRVDALVGIGVSVAKACREAGLPRVAYYRSKKEAGTPAKDSLPSVESAPAEALEAA